MDVKKKQEDSGLEIRNRKRTSTEAWQRNCSTIGGYGNLPLEHLVEDELKESWIKERKESDLHKNWSEQLIKLPGGGIHSVVAA